MRNLPVNGSFRECFCVDMKKIKNQVTIGHELAGFISWAKIRGLYLRK
jgi:hypothetical protein